MQKHELDHIHQALKEAAQDLKDLDHKWRKLSTRQKKGRLRGIREQHDAIEHALWLAEATATAARKPN